MDILLALCFYGILFVLYYVIISMATFWW